MIDLIYGVAAAFAWYALISCLTQLCHAIGKGDFTFVAALVAGWVSIALITLAQILT